MTHTTRTTQRTRRRGAVLVAAAMTLSAAACGDDSDAVTTTPDTTSTVPAPTVSITPTTAAVTDPVPAVAVWPTEGTAAPDDPVDAATQFAVEFVGFNEPLVGAFIETDAVSGEVAVRARESGPATTVFLRRIEGVDGWAVSGASSPTLLADAIDLSEPSTSPIRLTGESTAFEGTVGVMIFDRSGGEALANSFVMGGANGEMGPFDGSIDFAPPATDHGSVVFSQVSQESGFVDEATVVAVRFR